MKEKINDYKLPDGYVSKNFQELEFVCPCCGKYIHNTILLYALEKLRILLGGLPMYILSGTRCESHNAAIGGAKHSKHLTGEAADILVPGISSERIAAISTEILFFKAGGIGQYGTWTHLDVRKDGPARW